MGGTSGVGLKTAEMFLDEGAKVAICGRSAERMESAQSQLLSFGEKGRYFCINM